VEFNVVVDEIARLEPDVRSGIIDITHKMENGMADFAHKAVLSPTSTYIETIEDFDLYCHYVAGLVGEGLSRLFSATRKESPMMAKELVLSNSMGLLLQKVNILRDIREDIDDARYFWPKSVWQAHGFSHPAELRDVDKRDRALWVLSAMTLDALRHATDALDYLTLLKNQSIFNFCAIPAAMAIATLQLCFMNSSVFDRNIKIRKAQAADLIMKCTNPRDVSYMFRNYARQLHAKAVPDDPYFIKLSVALGKIEMWCEHHYPSFVVLRTPGGGQSGVAQGVTSDARRRIIKRQEVLAERKAVADQAQNPGRAIQAPQATPEPEGLPWQLLAAVALTFGLIFCIGWFVVWIAVTYFA